MFSNKDSALEVVLNKFEEKFEVMVNQKVEKFLGFGVQDKCSSITDTILP